MFILVSNTTFQRLGKVVTLVYTTISRLILFSHLLALSVLPQSSAYTYSSGSLSSYCGLILLSLCEACFLFSSFCVLSPLSLLQYLFTHILRICAVLISVQRALSLFYTIKHHDAKISQQTRQEQATLS